MARTLRIVNYAVNGAGVGHLTRLVAISRWLRRYAGALGVKLEIVFLTSSEADGLLFHERFASFKLPSKTVVGDAGLDKTAYLALAKQWVWHSLGLMRPDLLVVDSFPRGSFGELLSALDLCRQRAFVFRPMKEAFATRADFQAMLPLYDRILVPETSADVPVPEAARARVRHVGPVLVRERAELLPRAEARARLGVPDGRLAVYVSAGGGGDAVAEAQLEGVVGVLRDDPSLHLVVGAGPLYRGRQLVGERITWLAGGGAAELMQGLDLAVCAAGYNTFGELMQAGVPAIFLPQDKIADEQDVRAARAIAVGAAQRLPAGARSLAEALRGLPALVQAWREPAVRAAASEAARALLPDNGARHAAAELLRLVLPASEVEAAEALVGDAMLAAARALGQPLEPFLEVARALEPGSDDASIATSADPGAAGALAVHILRDVVERGIPVPAALRVITALSRKLVVATAAERATAARALLGELAAFDDWAGAATLLKVFGVERESAPAFAGELRTFLETLRGRGEDLYRGIAYLAGAQGAGAELPSNRELLRAATRQVATKVSA